MLVYVNGQMLDSEKDDLLIIGLEGNEKERLQNLTAEQNTLALYDGTKHKTEDVQIILNMLKMTIAERAKSKEGKEKQNG
jgi:hypothetical protein